MATYSTIRLQTTGTTAVATTSGGVTTVTSVASGTNYDCAKVFVDDSNDIIKGVAANGDVYVFESGAGFNISINA